MKMATYYVTAHSAAASQLIKQLSTFSLVEVVEYGQKSELHEKLKVKWNEYIYKIAVEADSDLEKLIYHLLRTKEYDWNEWDIDWTEFYMFKIVAVGEENV